MKKVNEINEKLMTVLEEKIQLLEEQKAINENIIKRQEEQLDLHVFGCSLTDKEKIDYELSQKQKIKHKETKDWLYALWFVILIMFLFAIAVKGCS